LTFLKLKQESNEDLTLLLILAYTISCGVFFLDKQVAFCHTMAFRKQVPISISGQTGEICPNLPKSSIPTQKFNVDSNPLQLSVRLLFALMGASTCCSEAQADTQFTIFDLSASEKQLPIFISNIKL
jgi:hypothetical protein